MTLPATPPITAQDINVELGRAASAPFSINGAEERALAGIPAGAIAFTDFLGKSAAMSVTFVDTASGNNNIGSFSINIDIGPSDANKTVFIVGHTNYPGGTSQTGFVSISIDGTPATTQEFASADDGSSQGLASWIISAEVSTSGVVTVAGTYAPFGVEGDTVIASYYTTSDFNVTETLGDARTDASSPYGTQVLIDVAEQGWLIAGSTSSIQGVGMSWTGATETYDDNIVGDQQGRYTGALAGPLSAQSNRTVRAEQTGSFGTEGVSVVAITIVKA